jgi:hypothetical protein
VATSLDLWAFAQGILLVAKKKKLSSTSPAVMDHLYGGKTL